MDDLHAELSTNPPLPGSYTARKGDLCAALFVDNNWYVSNSPHPPRLLQVLVNILLSFVSRVRLIRRHLVVKFHFIRVVNIQCIQSNLFMRPPVKIPKFSQSKPYSQKLLQATATTFLFQFPSFLTCQNRPRDSGRSCRALNFYICSFVLFCLSLLY